MAIYTRTLTESFGCVDWALARTPVTFTATFTETIPTSSFVTVTYALFASNPLQIGGIISFVFNKAVIKGSIWSIQEDPNGNDIAVISVFAGYLSLIRPYTNDTFLNVLVSELQILPPNYR